MLEKSFHDFYYDMPYARRRSAGSRRKAVARAMARSSGKGRYRKAGRRYGGGYRNRRTRATAGLTISPFGKSYRCVLEYQDLLDLNSVGGVLNYLTYAVNGCYDPYTGAGGHQPRYFDTFCGANTTSAPYRQYRVFGCKVDATFINTAGTIGEQGQVFLHARTANSAALVDIIDLGESPNVRQKPLGSSNGGGITSLSMYVSMKKMLAVKDLKDSEFSAGDYQANALDTVYVDVGMAPYLLQNANYTCVLKLTFYVEFFDQNYPQQS